MGVRGLTSFIARHAELYLQPYELHDSHLVIDGDNLACNLYKDVTGTCSAFGGDYDDFYRAVVQFFHVLAECNVIAFVLMDGGYERKKLRTVATRLRGKIAVIKRINPCGSIPVFPLLMKEVFVDAVRDCGVPVMRCVFEADDELAALGRKLNCPVLSYDSDFYIHNVRYIPLITLTVKAHTKRVVEKENGVREAADAFVERKMRRNEAKKVEKRTKANRVLTNIQVDAVEKNTLCKGKTYKYLDCCMYRIKNLIARGGSLSEEKLPLFAALLGNDYIARSSFKNLFASVGRGRRSRKLKQQQRWIRVILQWLKHETAETALQKIIGRLKLNQRESLLAQMAAATSGYSNEKCHSYDYFITHYENPFGDFMEQNDTSVSDENDTSDCDEEEEVVDEQADDTGENDVDENDDLGEEHTQSDGLSVDGVDPDDDVKLNTDEDNTGEEEEDDAEEAEVDKTKEFPAWFLEKLYPAHLPRFAVDLWHLKKYINSPQIEHFPHNDCNEVALPILIHIFTLMHSVQTDHEQDIKAAEDVEKQTIEFTYLTRATRVTNICYHRYSIGTPPEHPFDPHSSDLLLLQNVITDSIKNIDADRLFTEQLQMLPADLQLYFLAIIYWLQKSQHCDLLHLHALIICLVVLRTIDSKIPAERDLKDFQKRFGKIIKRERLVREKEVADGIKRGIKEELRSLSVPERMAFVPKSDCYLVQDVLLKHFHMQEIFKKKYDLYSTTVLHAFAEFQSVVFQLNSLNALLGFPLAGVRMGQAYCGVFLYNIYDLLRNRLDVKYYVQHFIFKDSVMMFDFYSFLMDWCDQFVPQWKSLNQEAAVQSVNKKVLKKRRQAERKVADRETFQVDPSADITEQVESEEDDFFDLNNKFCTLLKVK